MVPTTVDPVSDQVPPEPVPATTGRWFVPRRAPRYRVFVGTGVGLGLVVAAVLTYVGDPTQSAGYGAVFGYLAVFCSLLGALAGSAVAVTVEWAFTRARRGPARRPRR